MADGGAAAAAAAAQTDSPTPSDPPRDSLAPLCSCVRTLIDGLGEDGAREGLVDTPKVRGQRIGQRAGRARHRAETLTPHLHTHSTTQRVAKAWLDMTAGYKADIDR
jgi:GTP cyclohydrolase I